MLRVKKPGLLTTVQDLGRPNAIAAGVPAGGAMDRFAHRAANLLVGNDEGAATLECTLSGPELVALESCLVAVTGADFDPRVNGEPEPTWTGMFLSRGDELSFAGRRQGGRSYIAVAGGIAADRWLGSMSTNLMTARGGVHGRHVLAGDMIAVAGDAGAPAISGRHLGHNLRPDYADHTLRAIVGPHIRRLGAEGRKTLFSSEFKVSRDADRMGYRLEGPALDASGDELLSFGLAAGALQVPRSGQPILLMADRQTVGGYLALGHLIAADRPKAAQLWPGDELRFLPVGLSEAHAAANRLAAALS